MTRRIKTSRFVVAADRKATVIRAVLAGGTMKGAAIDAGVSYRRAGYILQDAGINPFWATSEERKSIMEARAALTEYSRRSAHKESYEFAAMRLREVAA